MGIILIYLIMLIPQYSKSYFGALQDKVDRLETIQGPKIVLIGNSNVAFGYNSALLSEKMGMPVVNMGFHGGLGNKFHEDMMDYNVQPGDIYVVSHITYWNTGRIESPIDAWAVAENHPKLWHLIKKVDYKHMFKAFPSYIKKCVTRHITLEDMNEPSGAYARSSFNEYGDIGVDRNHVEKAYSEEIWAPITSKAEFDSLNEWNTYLQSRGASLVIAGFPIMYDHWPVDDEYMDTFQSDMENGFECAVISKWRDYCYPDEFFYDTQYHLTTEGANARTEQLIRDLTAYLEQENAR